MKKFVLISIILGALSSTLLSCGSPPAKVTEGSSTTPDNTSFEDNTALYLSVTSSWEGSAEQTLHKSCSISSVLSAGHVETCDIDFPEGQMYFSDITFTVGTKMAALCPIVSFTPYAYVISKDNTSYTQPYATTPLDCSGTKWQTTAECWGGAATQIVSDFPKNSTMYILTATLPEKGYTLDSENKTRWYGFNSTPPYLKNFLATNNMAPADRGSSRSGVYVANTFQDYYITCQDYWYHTLYTIKLNLNDENSDGGTTLDEVQDWLSP